jgi:hypothetical protein
LPASTSNKWLDGDAVLGRTTKPVTELASHARSVFVAAFDAERMIAPPALFA